MFSPWKGSVGAIRGGSQTTQTVDLYARDFAVRAGTPIPHEANALVAYNQIYKNWSSSYVVGPSEHKYYVTINVTFRPDRVDGEVSIGDK